MSDLIEIRCKSCSSLDMKEEDGFFVCENCGAKHTIPGSLKGAGTVVLKKITPKKAQAGSKAFVFLWVMLAGPMFLFIPWAISFFVSTIFGVAIFEALHLSWLAASMPTLGAVCWPTIILIAVIIFVREAVSGSDQVEGPKSE